MQICISCRTKPFFSHLRDLNDETGLFLENQICFFFSVTDTSVNFYKMLEWANFTAFESRLSFMLYNKREPGLGSEISS